mmetsp:Transcript_6098/g.8932  ORF Transcript_6098/g.8932 Transcript_6098/m.8932 type:complete len:723 (+) Transcript_6098:215-2383(+)|eukprot:CAMPEP_0194218832 /NCGR_PEP_ID=MMETSP0156-20130528/24594_1 /TAXON_ID=33649 /ORGANISM="Thalassionema nitzschioides, Strain L26-B" /LENGTH=722 /DNA_ID=CAMNT_0038948307 /DNA_START=157 /DNA_END=2325 /DNA_ORIENTATION=+
MHSSEGMVLPSPVPAAAPRSYRRMYGSGTEEGGDSQRYERDENEESPNARRSDRPSGYHDEEGVEVVLDRNGNASSAKVVDSPSRRRQDQNVFRPPPHPSAHRPRAMRAQHGHPPMQESGSYGYAPPPPRRGEYGSHRAPMQVPYSHSGSFDENYPPPPPAQTQHYSPPVHYPTPGGGYQSSDVNVISPNHKPDPYGPPATPRSRNSRSQHYQYPPTSPVSRSGATNSNSPPRKHYRMKRTEGPYSVAQRDGHSYHPDDGTFNHYQPSASSGERPPLVTESSFDSGSYHASHYSPHQSHPPTPGGHREARSQFYGESSFGSFETAPPPHFDDYRYYGYKAESHYSPGQPYYGDHAEHYSPHHPYDRPHHEEGEHRAMRDYHHDSELPQSVTPNDKNHGEDEQGKTVNGMMIPKAASEIDFEVTSPPAEPVVPPSDHPLCDSPAAINSHDVLCGRGGGTNSQIGNRRFRQLVQEFQPTYLLARRKEKPLLARTIVLIIRKRGGRFLKKNDDSGELYEVGDSKAEAKTSQALREGLDVRATKSAANSLVDKKKKKGLTKQPEKEELKEVKREEQMERNSGKEEENRPKTPTRDVVKGGSKTPPSSPPPSLPRLQQDIKAGVVHPHSPEAIQFRKRRRMRSGACGAVEDKLFPDFCPPRADLQRSASPFADDDHLEMASTPPHRNMRNPDEEHYPQPGCAGIAMSIMTGAATGSFCLGPKTWRKK